MEQAAKSFARADERQFVFVVAADSGFTIAETAELWEEPWDAPELCYFCYPTVLGGERFASLDAALAEVARRYPWTRGAEG